METVAVRVEFPESGSIPPITLSSWVLILRRDCWIFSISRWLPGLRQTGPELRISSLSRRKPVQAEEAAAGIRQVPGLIKEEAEEEAVPPRFSLLLAAARVQPVVPLLALGSLSPAREEAEEEAAEVASCWLPSVPEALPGRFPPMAAPVGTVRMPLTGLPATPAAGAVEAAVPGGLPSTGDLQGLP